MRDNVCIFEDNPIKINSNINISYSNNDFEGTNIRYSVQKV